MVQLLTTGVLGVFALFSVCYYYSIPVRPLMLLHATSIILFVYGFDKLDRRNLKMGAIVVASLVILIVTTPVSSFVFTWSFLFLGIFYTLFLRNIFLLKNIVVAVCWTNGLFIYPILFNDLSIHPTIITSVLMILSFIMSFNASTSDDVLDIEEDMASGAKTLPVLIGIPATIMYQTALIIIGSIIIAIYHKDMPIKLMLIWICYVCFYNIFTGIKNRKLAGFLLDADLLILSMGLITIK